MLTTDDLCDGCRLRPRIQMSGERGLVCTMEDDLLFPIVQVINPRAANFPISPRDPGAHLKHLCGGAARGTAGWSLPPPKASNPIFYFSHTVTRNHQIGRPGRGGASRVQPGAQPAAKGAQSAWALSPGGQPIMHIPRRRLFWIVYRCGVRPQMLKGRGIFATAARPVGVKSGGRSENSWPAVAGAILGRSSTGSSRGQTVRGPASRQ